MSLSNSQYNAIMRIYNQRQFQDKYEQDERVKEVYRRIPQIRQLEDAMSSQAVACARRLLDGDERARQRLKDQLEDLREQKAVLLAAYGYDPDYMEMRYTARSVRIPGMWMERSAGVLRKRRSPFSTPSPIFRRF